MSPSVCAVICAAGKGSRAGFEKNKLLVPYQGATVLEKTLSAFCLSCIDELIVTASESDLETVRGICAPFQATVVLGGTTRSKSVYNALKQCKSDVVLIHDGARPFVTREVIEGCIDSVKRHGSGICAVECRDTVAQAKDDVIEAVPPRDSLRQIQTPQGFFREKILYAYEQAFLRPDTSYTDDSSVYAAFCEPPRLCAGAHANVKMTYAEDFSGGVTRCGYGIDTHAFGKPQNYIVLAGVQIPSKSGLIAHSDGDVLVHAVMDALLSAAGLKDIGHYFPDTDERWKGASSMNMLQSVLSLLSERGYGVQNLSVAVQAERPRLAKYIEQMKNNLAEVLGIDGSAIGISAGTNEGLGYVGEGKGITVHAYVLLHN